MSGDNFKFTDNSQQFKEALESQLQTALEAVGIKAEGYAKGLSPVDTGRLRNSISHTVQDDAAYIGTNVEYAPYQELGVPKHNIKAHHFLKQAVENHSAEYKSIVEKSLK